MTVDPIQQGLQQILLEQVTKSMLETTGDKPNPFAALMSSALADEVSK
jgi:hypothetical protein